jgi:monoamine oxidase
MPENTKENELGNPKYDVIVVGAGMAGLSAAYRILTQRPGTKLLILESRGRMGERIWSIRFDTKKFGLDSVLEGGRSIDLGARRVLHLCLIVLP